VVAPSNAVTAGPGVHYTLLYDRDLDLKVNASQTLGQAARLDLPAAEVDALAIPQLVTALVGGI